MEHDVTLCLMLGSHIADCVGVCFYGVFYLRDVHYCHFPVGAVLSFVSVGLWGSEEVRA